MFVHSCHLYYRQEVQRKDLSMSQALVEPEVQVNRDWKLLINGKLEAGFTERQLFNPSTGEVLCKVKQASTEQVERAIQAVRDAFDSGPCPHMAASERVAILLRVAALVNRRASETPRNPGIRRHDKMLDPQAPSHSAGLSDCFAPS